MVRSRAAQFDVLHSTSSTTASSPRCRSSRGFIVDSISRFEVRFSAARMARE
jgi:hypothetical protein